MATCYVLRVYWYVLHVLRSNRERGQSRLLIGNHVQHMIKAYQAGQALPLLTREIK